MRPMPSLIGTSFHDRAWGFKEVLPSFPFLLVLKECP